MCQPSYTIFTLSRLLAVLFAGGPGMLFAGELRKWAYEPPDGQGSETLEAELVGLQGVLVVLQRPDGTRSEVPLARLSPDDNRYVQYISRTDHGEYTDWTDSFGNKVLARYAGISGDSVLLVTKEGGTFRIPWIKLTRAQQDFVIESQRMALAARSDAVNRASVWRRLTDVVEMVELTAGAMPDKDKAVWSLDFSADGRLLLSAGAWKGCRITLWNVHALKPQCQWTVDSFAKDCRACQLRVFAARGAEMWHWSDRYLARIDTASGRLLNSGDGRQEFQSLTKHLGKIEPRFALGASPDGKTVAVRVYQEHTQSDLLCLLDASTFEVVETIPLEKVPFYWGPLMWSEDGSIIVGFQTCPRPDKGFFAVNLRTRRVQVFDNDRYGFRLIDKGRTIGIAGGDKVRFFATDTGKQSHEWAYPKPPGKAELDLVAIAPRESRVALRYERSGIVYLYDWSTGEIVIELPDSDARITCMEFSPDGKILAVADAVGGIKLFRFLNERDIAGGATDKAP